MSRDVRMPRNLRAHGKLYGRLTWPNMVRLCLPIVILVVSGFPFADSPVLMAIELALGVTMGFSWIRLRWHEHHPEYHLVHIVRWVFAGRNGR